MRRRSGGAPVNGRAGVGRLLVLAPATALCLARAPAAQQRMTRAELEVAVQKDSNDPVLHFNLGQAYAREGRAKDAKHEYVMSVAIDGQFAPGYLALARMAVAGRFAIRFHGRYVLIGGRPSSDSALMMLQRTFMLDPLQELREPEEYAFPTYWRGTIERAMREYRSGDYRSAREQFDTVITKMRTQGDSDPRIISVLWYHLLSSVHLSDYPRAIDAGEAMLDRALRAEAADSSRVDERVSHEFEWVLAHLNERAQRFQEAERLYQRAVEDNLGQYMAHVELANMYEAQNRFEDAATERQLAMSADPGDASLELQAGLTDEYAGHVAQADTLLRQAISDNPRETRSYYVLGLVDLQLGKTDDAKKALDQFIALAPSRYVGMLDDARRRRAALN
ncbi:MAG TPA: tetratricopeptide repeat protein [Gemmatimonadales bacterium]|nr:tetratricopeptide repeat protein [Gemmatimonadales bacterium]